MATYQAVDCQGFAGGFTLGTVQAGFELVGKREMPPAPGFGVPNCEGNRHLLGGRWQTQVSDPAEWEPVPAHYVFGNPPCSGFSNLTHGMDFHGMESPINACMWAFTEFTARTMPYVAAFESVQHAFGRGRPLMQALRAHLEHLTGEQWTLFHVKHNNLSVGGAAMRKRYFWCVSRIPFGIEIPDPPLRLPVLHDVLDDLLGLEQTWQPQSYRRPATWWSAHLRNDDGFVDGHICHRRSIHHRRLLEDVLPHTGWAPGEVETDITRRYYETHGCLPPSFRPEYIQRCLRRNWDLGFNSINRHRGERTTRVMTGAALEQIVHPREDRMYTHREVARCMGFPDAWRIDTIKGYSALRQSWGKGIPVESGRWISTWVNQALHGNPGSHQGELIGEREFLIDITNAYRAADRRTA